jgi:hypothetical protein
MARDDRLENVRWQRFLVARTLSATTQTLTTQTRVLVQHARVGRTKKRKD